MTEPIRTTADPNAEEIKIGDYEVPDRIAIRVPPRQPGSPTCYLTCVARNGRFICTELRITHDDGITSTDSRIPISKYIREGVEMIGELKLPDDSEGPYWVVEADDTRHPLGHDKTLIAGGVTHTKAYKKANPRFTNKPVDDETLRAVANIYQRAIVQRKPPTKTVYEQIPNISRTTAGRWVTKARERGFLGAAQPRVAGEA